jgi:hypothetical protein
MNEPLNAFNPPQTWEELVELKPKIRHSTPETARLPEDLAFYQLYTKLVPRDIRLEIIKQLIGDNDYKILQNNFPYLKLLSNLPEVKHYCLWSRIGELPLEIIESEITKKFPGKKYFWLENSLQTKSIPEIWHCHIFVKEK